MKRMSATAARILAYACIGSAGAATARGFLGFADTSFVTVIANPAEAANWAAELQRLNEQVAAAAGTLKVVGDLRAFAGDPKAAVGAVPGLEEITAQLNSLASGAQTGGDLLKAWRSLGASSHRAAVLSLLDASGAGATMQVFGTTQARDASLYERLAGDAGSAAQIRSQIASEQQARSLAASELALAWGQFKGATTESGKQAILAEISQIQSQSQVMDARRRAMLDDLELSDRQGRASAEVRSRSTDEQLLAESALLSNSAAARAREAETQRQATLQKAVPASPAADYSGLRLWTTADAAGGPNASP